MKKLLLALATISSAALAAPMERRLHIAQAEASSFDKNDYNRFEENYLPLYVGDDDASTAWTEGVPGDGVGQWLRVRFSSMKGATKVRLRIRNGYQKSHKLFLANERARKVTFKLLPSNVTVQRELKDAEGWQEVVIDQPAGVLAGVELGFASIYKGTKYEDLCISDVQVYVTAETPDNPAFEKAVLGKLLAWKSDRVVAAKAFAQSRTMPVAASYAVDDDPKLKDAQRSDDFFGFLKTMGATSDDERAVATSVHGWLANKAAAFEPVTLSTNGQAPLPVVDGLCSPSTEGCSLDFCDAPLAPLDHLPLMTTSSFKVIEAKERPPVAALIDAALPSSWRACHSNDGATLAWAVRQGDDHRTRALLVMTCKLVEGREGKYVGHMTQLFAYDDAGHLRLSTTQQGVTTYAWKGERVERGRYLSPMSGGAFSASDEVAASAK